VERFHCIRVHEDFAHITGGIVLHNGMAWTILSAHMM
jgi:hypothetical protein